MLECSPRSPFTRPVCGYLGVAHFVQVIVWDTSRDDPLLATTKIDTLFHREPVTSVSMIDKDRLVGARLRS